MNAPIMFWHIFIWELSIGSLFSVDKGKIFSANQLSLNTLSNVYPFQQVVMCKAFVDPMPHGGIIIKKDENIDAYVTD